MDVKSEALLRCFRSLKAVPVPALFGSRTALSGLSGRQLPPVAFPLVLVWGLVAPPRRPRGMVLRAAAGRRAVCLCWAWKGRRDDVDERVNEKKGGFGRAFIRTRREPHGRTSSCCLLLRCKGKKNNTATATTLGKGQRQASFMQPSWCARSFSCLAWRKAGYWALFFGIVTARSRPGGRRTPIPTSVMT